MIDELHFFNITCIEEKTREIVCKSDTFIVLGLTLKALFLLDQVTKQEDATFSIEIKTLEKIEGSGFDPKINILATWVTFKGDKPKLIDVSRETQGMEVVQTFETTNPLVFTIELMHREIFNRAQMKHMKEEIEEF